LNDVLVAEIFAEFQPDLTDDYDTFLRQCQRWRVKWQGSSPLEHDSTEKARIPATDASYPNIRACLQILLCMPDATASAERSFSTMRRVKTYLRSTMSTERMSGLGLLNIYREREINAEQVVDIFARKKDRRLALVFKVSP